MGLKKKYGGFLHFLVGASEESKNGIPSTWSPVPTVIHLLLFSCDVTVDILLPEC